MTYPSLYSIVQFKPYRETDEFANIGVVLCCPSAGYFGFMINNRSFARINHFFEHLELPVLREAVRYVTRELERVQQLAYSLNAESLKSLFAEVTKNREGIMLFSAARPIMLQGALDDELKALYEHHVGHSFAQKAAPQVLLERQMRQTLVEHELARFYKGSTLTDGLVEAKIPFVSQGKLGVLGAIKPLNLQHDSPTKIIEEGDKWFGKLRRLVGHGVLEAGRVLLPLAMPTANTKLTNAAKLVADEFKRERMVAINANDEDHLLSFARSHAE
ncbi:DUF3037 domain-containing protein [Oceanimonas smirnovii]|uniref:DUF3037 domain-containing protein n=1 Tax=Oceanimonas smirnovii TaxID=264574 RepID=UPI00035E6E3B|nr:DUF3037 domain-containing protein [Oceanimonas smirnovii]